MNRRELLMTMANGFGVVASTVCLRPALRPIPCKRRHLISPPKLSTSFFCF